MASIDPIFAQWLQSEALQALAEDAGLRARWGDSAAITKRITTLATKADAVAEAGRQLAFMGGPLVVDEHVLLGEWRQRLGRVITLTIAQLGYDAGVAVFVIGAQDNLAAGTSVVTVLRRL